MFHIDINKRGIQRIYGTTGSVSDSIEISDFVRATGLSTQLLHNSVVEYFTKNAALNGALDELGDPTVWVPTQRDTGLDLPRKIVVNTAHLPRDAYDGVPDWFTEGCRKLFPDADWANAEKPLPKDVLLSVHSKRYIEQHRNLSEEQLNELADPSYCSRTEEFAVGLFHEHVNGLSRKTPLLDHWGWCEEGEKDVLVSEPYRVNQEALMKLGDLCAQVGWEYSIQGTSGHHPSRTIRIVIQPKDKS